MAGWSQRLQGRWWRRLLTAGSWLLALGLLGLGTQLRSPFVLKARGTAYGVWLVGTLVIIGLAARRWRRAQNRRQNLAAAALLACGLLAALAGIGVHGRHLVQRREIGRAPVAERALLARHVVAGFRSWDEAQELVGETLVGGVYVGQHNARGLSADELHGRITALQALRRARGLSPLLVSVDQEGGPVSRLSPPLPFQPPLSEVLADDDSPAERDRRVREFATQQATALRRIGANINFSPVVDLRLHPERSLLDRYSFIGARAISAKPAVVATVARSYAEALLAQGVVPTAKHFPGLGRVRTDTHFFTAQLTTPMAELMATDWLPFRATVDVAPTLLMLGHVVVTDLDADHLASGSARLVDGVIRGTWGHQGVLITDDLCMGPVMYGPGSVAGFAVTALQAGVDLLLISYDGTQVYPALAALLHARRRGALPDELLQRSAARLDRLAAFVEQQERRILP